MAPAPTREALPSEVGPLLLQPLVEERRDDGLRVWTCRRRGAPGPVPDRLVALLGDRDPVHVAIEACEAEPPAQPDRETGWRVHGRLLPTGHGDGERDDADRDDPATLPDVLALVAIAGAVRTRTCDLRIRWLPADDRGRGSMAAPVRDGDTGVLHIGRWRLPVTLSAPPSSAPPGSIRSLTLTCDPPVWLAPGLVVHLERSGTLVASATLTPTHP